MSKAALAASVALITVLVLPGGPVPASKPASASEWLGLSVPRALVLSAQAQRFLALQYRAFPTEFMGCMIGEVRGRRALVQRIAPADVEPAQSTGSWVAPTQTCEEAGWTGTIGMIHSHPAAERCWYYFPGTQVLSSDGNSFLRTPYPVDAIMCGDRVVWISRDMVQKQVALVGAGEWTSSVAEAR